MLKINSTYKSFVLLINNKIDTTSQDWDKLRDYCSETGKRGQVYVVENTIPFDGNISDIVTTTKYWGEVK